MHSIQRLPIFVGDTLTVIGCLSLAPGAVAVIDLEHFATVISSGVRAIVSVAIAGCLLSAIGHGTSDPRERYKAKG